MYEYVKYNVLNSMKWCIPTEKVELE